MRTIARLSLIIILALASLAGACSRRDKSRAGNPGQTNTIAPAAGQPSPTGTDAMTQTVEVDDSRSEDEGGVITNPRGAPPAKSTTPTKAPPKTAAPKKKKGK